jgi:general secretion pathway protein F
LPVFEYRGVDTGGKDVRGIIDADTPKLARSKLKKTGVFPTKVQETLTDRGGGGMSRWPI